MRSKREQPNPSQAQTEAPEAGGAVGANPRKSVGRRHALRALLGGAAATVGAAVLGATRPNEASADVTGNFTSSTTTPAVTAANTDGGFGVQGSSTGFNAGIGGFATGGGASGVYGESSSFTGYGVYGNNTASGGNGSAGVRGDGPAYGVLGSGGTTGVSGQGAFQGVYGFSSSNVGVRGDSSGGVGVYGTSFGGISNGIGVWGQSLSAPAGVEGDNSAGGPGVFGKNTGSGPGVLAYASSTQAAVFGQSNAAGSGTGVLGQATGLHSAGLVGTTDHGFGFFGGATIGAGDGVGAYVQTIKGIGLFADGGSNIAGYFQGPIIVTGSSTVMGAKSAAVKDANGSLRRLYSLECPESWFEDFSSAQLSGGSATVQLAPDFAGVVHSDAYYVFPVPEGDCKGLYVSSKTPGGFTVREAGGGTSNIAFSYRVVAKRRDIAGARMEHVEEPKLPAPPTLPKPPVPPPTPPAIPPAPPPSATHKPPTLPPAP